LFFSENGGLAAWLAGFSAEDFGVEVNSVAVLVGGAREQRHGDAKTPEKRK